MSLELALGCRLVLLHDAGGDAPAVADRDALALRPRPDAAAALPARRGTPGPAPRPPARLAGVPDEGRQLPAERRGVLAVQIYLVIRAVDPEPHRLIRRATIKIVFQRDGYLLCHPRLPDCDRLFAPYKINCPGVVTATPPIVDQDVNGTPVAGGNQCAGWVNDGGSLVLVSPSAASSWDWVRNRLSARSAPRRSAPRRSAPVRSASLRPARLRSAPMRRAPRRSAPVRSALLRPAPIRSAPR